jgi:hypothetical protein
MLRRVALVRTRPGASFIRVTRIDELGTTKAATSNRRTLVFLRSVRRLLVAAFVEGRQRRYGEVIILDPTRSRCQTLAPAPSRPLYRLHCRGFNNRNNNNKQK